MPRISIKAKLLILGYFLSSVALLLYSFTQVDLSLTLSRASIWQMIQKQFQNIGFYQRPLSTGLFIGILFLFFILYHAALRYFRGNGKATKKELWLLVGVVTFLLVLSYPAFSYDIFNYMFTAKTVLLYHKNPYLVIPLQFTGFEPMLSFMRWTHLPSAYTPIWILLTLPVYIFSYKIFLLFLINFKILAAAFYLGTTYLVGKILEKVAPKYTALGMAIFALNPLIIVETLVSAHNDISMMFFALLAYYFYLERKTWTSFFTLAVSVAFKLMTFFLVPVFFLKWKRTWAFAAMMLAFILVQFQREVLPWYFVWVVPLLALIPEKREWVVISSGISLGLLLRYAPYLYLGNWDPPADSMKLWGTVIPIAVSLVVVGIQFITGRFHLQKKAN